ncbi:MAG: glucose-6-phosphate isomerase [Microbacterium sp.]|nr:glucose-6-phosphate isomerase [Microbacterium sp.]
MPSISVSGSALAGALRVVPELVAERVASRLFARDDSLWGEDARAEASKRLGWVDAAVTSKALIEPVLALRDQLRAQSIDRVVLCGMGGSSLAPEVISHTWGAQLTVLDSTEPGQVLSAVSDRLERTVVVISSKSGSTLETDSHRRIFESRFRQAGIDPASRIVVVTDPGSPLEASAREAGYRVFLADPEVGGRYSALTAFGLVPSGLAGVDIGELLAEAGAAHDLLASDDESNPALHLGALLAWRDKLGVVPGDSPIVGFGDWAEQLIAESTGKAGTGVLPVVLDAGSPELTEGLGDLSLVQIVADAVPPTGPFHATAGGGLGGQFLLWESATAVAGRLLGINPFDQPDVESAKAAARGLLDAPPAPAETAFSAAGIAVSGSGADGAGGLAEALDGFLSMLPPNGYVAIQAYLDRVRVPDYPRLRDQIARRTNRPVTFGWGPRFLHSTGQFHKGGTPVGIFLQLTADPGEDLAIPGRPFSFGQLIAAQAAGDAAVLESLGRPVLKLHLSDPASALSTIQAALG